MNRTTQNVNSTDRAGRSNPWNAYSQSLRSQGVFAKSLLVIALLVAAILASSAYFAIAESEHIRTILKQNARFAVSATCQASAELIDTGDVFRWQEPADIENDNYRYSATLISLQQIQVSVGAKRIYVVRQVGDHYVILFDTQDQNTLAFTEVELTDLQTVAFSGFMDLSIVDPGKDDGADINTGAMPLRRAGSVIGIVCVEFDNTNITAAYNTSLNTVRMLVGSLAVMMILLFMISVFLFMQNRRNQQQLFIMANMDMNTGIPNRRYLFTYLSDRLDNPASTKLNIPVAAFFIDLDNFKLINDQAGHAEGDRFLAMLAKFFSDNLNQLAYDTRRECLTTRLGGDEFVQLLADTDIKEAEEYAINLIADLEHDQDLHPYVQNFKITCSIGVAMYPDHTRNYNDLVKYADIAMYYAKRKGKGSSKVYEPEMGEQVEGVTLSVREAKDRV